MMASLSVTPGIIVYRMVYIETTAIRQLYFIPIGILFAMQHFGRAQRAGNGPYRLGHIASVVSISCSSRSRGTSAPACTAMP